MPWSKSLICSKCLINLNHVIPEVGLLNPNTVVFEFISIWTSGIYITKIILYKSKSILKAARSKA